MLLAQVWRTLGVPVDVWVHVGFDAVKMASLELYSKVRLTSDLCLRREWIDSLPLLLSYLKNADFNTDAHHTSAHLEFLVSFLKLTVT